MATLVNNAEGGTNTTTVTTANSGGSSGDAWDAVVIGATGGTGLTFDNTHVGQGSLAYEVITGANTDNAYLSWKAAFGTQTLHYGRVNLWTAANPSAVETVVNFRTGANALACRFAIVSTGEIRLVSSAGSTLGTTTAKIGLSQWVRLEYKVDHTNGVFEVRLFNNPDSVTETVTSAGASSLGTNANDVWFGKSGGQNIATTWWLDSINSNTTDYPGPDVPSAPSLPNNFKFPSSVSAGVMSLTEKIR